MLTPRRVPSGRFTFFTSTTSVVSKLPLVTLASARARPSGTTPPMAGPESLASVVVPPACATPDPVVTSTLAMARPMRTLDHVAFMTARFLPHASVLRPDQPREDRGTRAPRSRSSPDGRRHPHPGMDEALEAVDSRRQRCGRHRAPGPHQRRREGPAREPRALRHRGQPQQVVEGGDAAAAEVGDLGEGVVLAAAVLGLK